ncbi:hypothetical protein [Chryseobacterium taiwanense]|uniref:Uncharacterized protein n=1 Tax=Chryseobacterium taiwanense TaxID=363331 RepID=A0A0B4E469_9FLAO|nr:hypothetical protein [Chryseobacterium taiwanense]KIC61408.1 hypothetical protein RM51_17480 [Chryseobacterium taiwanense]
MKTNKLLRKLGSEFLMGIAGILGTHIETKIGLGIFLLIPGIAIFFSKEVAHEDNPEASYIIGTFLIFIAILLFFIRYKELRKKTE